MLNCEIHGAQDLRLTEVAPEALGPTQRVGVKAVGICGSDLHYYRHGRVGDFVIREPLTPGHEASGQVLEVGAAVTRVKPGDRVALDPARTCGVCRYCRQGDSNHCEAVHFSAAPAAIRTCRARCASRSWCRKVNACRCRTACPSSWPLSASRWRWRCTRCAAPARCWARRRWWWAPAPSGRWS